jgi:hypothetical protein
MSIFQKATNTQAFLKAGFMGFAGDGKTYTAVSLAIGLVELMRKREIPAGSKPVMFLDSETGAAWVKPRFDEADIELQVSQSRAFTDLLSAQFEAAENGSVLIVDSITHFWRDLTESYLRRKGKNYLEFQDWSYLKTEWGKFTDAFVNSPCHSILCGRAGYEYDFFERDDGKRELQKTGVKMKAETETGYEPSILVLMEKHRNMDTNEVWRTGTVLKDRSARLDGHQFKNPSFADFLPHIEYLNLGGAHVGVDTSRNSDSLFNIEGKADWKVRAEEKTMCLEEISEVIAKYHGGQDAASKKTRKDLMEQVFGTRAWSRIEAMKLETLKEGRNALWMMLEKHQYGTQAAVAPDDSEGDADLSVGLASKALTDAGTLEDLESTWTGVKTAYKNSGIDLPLELTALHTERYDALSDSEAA